MDSQLNNINYFIFGNKPPGEYEDSFWDTSTILETKEYFFAANVNLIYKPQKGDVVLFKEFDTKIYWGEAVLGSAKEELKQGDTFVVRFKLEGIKVWLYNLKTDMVHDELSNKDTRARIVSISKNDYDLIKSTMENNSPLSIERQEQIKTLWVKFKSLIKDNKVKNINELKGIKELWYQYREKILDDSLSLDDYTNITKNPSATMPGKYLCNFLEQTTKKILGNSRSPTALEFEVKLNKDNLSYSIKSQNKQNATKDEAERFFNDNIKGLLKDIVSAEEPLEKIRIIQDADYSAKQVLMKLAVLDNLSDFLHIYNSDQLEELYDEFIGGSETGDFLKNYQVCTVAKKLLDVNENDESELMAMSEFLWKYVSSKSIFDNANPNVILYGPPGTGKTHSVVNSLDFVCQGDCDRYEVLQFHPSYTYEDFIEGIKPKGVSKDGNIRFELVNGVFKNFCIKAKNNRGKNFYFVVDEINRANLSTVLGETLSLLEKDYRHDDKGSKNLIRTQYATLIDNLIKEDESYKDLAYAIDDGKVKFGVPDNVFFIGMMNDVDKSVDAFDLALRRRFKWIRKDCDYDVIEDETRFKNKEEFSNIGEYVKACKALNKYISDKLGLGTSYEFGHAFFMKMSSIAKRKEITSDNLETLFSLYLHPTLKEYLRAAYAESELDDKISEALKCFKQTF